MSWRKTIRTETPQESKKGSWRDTIKEDTSKLESGLRGTSQGLSMGFDDEIGGGLSAAGRVFGIEGLGGKLSEIGLADSGPTLDLDKIKEAYTSTRDAERGLNRQAQEDNPMIYGTGQVAGAVGASFVPGMNVIKGSSLLASSGNAGIQGALMGAGSSEADNALDLAQDTATGAGFGVAGGAAGYGAGKALQYGGKVLSTGANKLGGSLDDAAERLAVNATGATAKQVDNFADDAGRELLNRKLVKFGDTAESIADRTQGAMNRAGNNIDNVLTKLDDSGVSINIDDVMIQLQGQIDELSKVPGNDKLIKQLQSEVDNLYMGGRKTLPISVGEKAKRNYQSQVNYASPEAEKKASHSLADAFKNKVEGKALESNPELGALFKESKETYGLLAPIKEAAQRRANSQNQSQYGNLLDLAAGAYGLSDSDSFTGKAALAVAGRRFVAPRIASSGAVTADKLAQIIKSSPQVLGKYSNVFTKAAERGTQAISATHFILQQQDPEYRAKIQELEGNQDEEK